MITFTNAGLFFAAAAWVFAVYIAVALLLTFLGVFLEPVGAVGGPNGFVVDYAGPPLFPGVLLAAVSFPTISAFRPSWSAVVGATALIAVAAATTQHWELFLQPEETWTALRDRWWHPYVQEEVRSVQRELAYAFVCSGAAGAFAARRGYFAASGGPGSGRDTPGDSTADLKATRGDVAAG